MKIPVKTKTGGYDITLERGALMHAGEILNLNRRTVIVTDDGVPEKYAKTVAAQCSPTAHIITLPQGEKSKCVENFIYILKEFTSRSYPRRLRCSRRRRGGGRPYRLCVRLLHARH